MLSYDVTEFGAPLERRERPTPQPQGSEVLLRTLGAGVCHSDLHIRDGYYEMGQGKRLMVKDRGLVPPLTMGHEIVGEVLALGPEAEGVRIGDRRLAFPWIGCGECATCRRGEEQLCTQPRCLGVHRPGGYGDHVVVPHARYLLEIGKLTPAQAAPYACAGLTAYGALKKVGQAVLENQPIAVIGAGGLGHMCLSLLPALRAKGAIVVDSDPGKREAALRAGAFAAVDPKEGVRKLQQAAGEPIGAAIDFVGATETARLGFDAVCRGGKYVLVGLFGGDITLSLPVIPLRAVTIQGSYTGSLAELKELMALATGGAKLASVPLQERRFAEANQVLDELRDGRIVGRAVLTH